jgi:hypothetical protein
MDEVSLERVWERYENKYRFLVVASRETRRLIEAVAEGRIDMIEDPYRLGLARTIRGEAEEKPIDAE